MLVVSYEGCYRFALTKRFVPIRFRFTAHLLGLSAYKLSQALVLLVPVS